MTDDDYHRRRAAVVFDDFELLDMFGPLELFNTECCRTGSRSPSSDLAPVQCGAPRDLA